MKKNLLAKILVTLSTLMVIALVTHEHQHHIVLKDYERADYKHWIDADNDCQNTRQEVLISESIEPVKLDGIGCKVMRGKWYDPYTDQFFTNPKDVDIDHFVPLKEVHISGGKYWNAQKRIDYANDLNDEEVLIVVSKNANRQKGDKDPFNWMPSNKNYRCQYLKNWVKIKEKWQLEMDKSERDFIVSDMKNCEEQLPPVDSPVPALIR